MGKDTMLPQDEGFKKNRHRHYFTAGENLAEREEWLQKVEERCRTAGIKLRVRGSVDERGNPGYEFGFGSVSAYAAFIFNIFSDLEDLAGHTHAHVFQSEDRAYREAFLLAAESHLMALAIPHQSRELPDRLEFVFDRFTDRLLFQTLIDQGTIHGSAIGLASVHDLQQRVGSYRREYNFPSPDRE